MTAAGTWVVVLVAAGAAYALKLIGHVVPQRLLDGPRTTRVTTLLPVALLAALVGVQTFTEGSRIVVDARTASLGVAIVALLLRAPFLVVVVAAAATAAGLRHLGWA